MAAAQLAKEGDRLDAKSGEKSWGEERWGIRKGR
jgi:hypothetical protein